MAAELLLKKSLLCPLAWFLGFGAQGRLPAQREPCEPRCCCVCPAWAGGRGMLFIMDPEPGASRGESTSEQSCAARWAAGLGAGLRC